jgi:parallel beta-helix repeat protein
MAYTLDDVLRAIHTGLNDTLYYMFKAFCIQGAVSGIGSAITQPAGGQVPSGIRTATRIVAASNSLDRTRADYVCDGVHDEEEINKAISDLADTGGTVLLLEGTYNIGSAGIRSIQTESGDTDIAYGIYITSNVRLVGQGSSTILVTDSDNFDFSDSPFGAIILSDNASGIEVSHITINGNQQNLTTPIFGIFLADFTDRTSDSAVTDCYIYNTAIAICGYTDRCIVAENTCKDNVYNSITIGGDGNAIYGNICSDCMGFYSINIFISSNCTISDNICNANAGGIILYYSNGNIVSNNECCNSTLGTGIEVYNSSNNYIGGNVCISNEYGVFIDVNSSSNVVCNNVLCMNRMDGICIVANDNLISENLIAGNSQYGIGFRYGSGSYNTISGNVLRHMGTQSYGIYITGTGNMVINNDLYQAGTSADFYDSGTDTVYHNNRTTEGWIP